MFSSSVYPNRECRTVSMSKGGNEAIEDVCTGGGTTIYRGIGASDVLYIYITCITPAGNQPELYVPECRRRTIDLRTPAAAAAATAAAVTTTNPSTHSQLDGLAPS